MTEPSQSLSPRRAIRDLRDALRERETPDNAFADAALERHKHEGMRLAIRVRIVTMIVLAVMMPMVNPTIEVLFYEAIAVGFLVIGLAQGRIAAVGRSRAEVLLILADLVLMTLTFLIPNPLAETDWPLATAYRNEGFKYFFLLLAFSTLAYSWRTVWGVGVITVTIWGIGFAAMWFFSAPDPTMTAAAEAAFGPDAGLVHLMDPNNLFGGVRVQEVVVFLLVAGTLALNARRFTTLMYGHAALERERANLARYFSPNVVEELSHNDEPLKQIRNQNVAVLFVDIVGFTRFAAERGSEEVIGTLRDFHRRMEAEVFRYDGTLDKYLGDGLMATFGTPMAGARDAANALACARAMIASVDAWNDEREQAGDPPLRASFGIHYGPAVLGDIGANRLEFAVIGNTVNIASRVEALTRPLDAKLAVTQALKDEVLREGEDGLVSDLEMRPGQAIRGLDDRIDLWALPRA